VTTGAPNLPAAQRRWAFITEAERITMRAIVVRRTAVAACAVSLALLATACGGSESGGKGGDGEGKAKAGNSASAEPAAEAKTAAELEKLALADGDIEHHKVQKATAGDKVDADTIKTDRAECESLAVAVSGTSAGEPGATVQRKVVGEPEKNGEEPSLEELAEMSEKEMEEAFTAALGGTITMVSLSSYAGEGAKETVGSLRTAGEKCSGGFTMTVGGTEQKITKLAAEDVKGGEEALAWTVTAEQEGETAPLKLVVVRQGGVLASFSSMNIGAIGSGKDYELPVAVVDAQVKKLG
jgi:hypothetical protein